MTVAAEKISDDLRLAGRADELRHWREFCQSERFLNNFCKAIPNPEIDFEVEIFLKGIATERERSGQSLSILDVGSGPVSMLTNSFRDHGNVTLVAADPLADDYINLWMNPYKELVIKPIPCEGEKLSLKFGNSSFDVVHTRNALDHVIHPITVIEEIIKITRPTGYIVIHGFENEADAEGWAGFHQWNLSYGTDDLIIRGKNNANYSLASHFKGRIRVLRSWGKPLSTGKSWCGTIARVF